MMKILTRFSSLVSLALLAFPTTILALEPPSRLDCASTVFEPFVVRSGNKISGIDVEVIKEVGRRLNIVVEFHLMPWKRLEQNIKEGTETCVAAYFRTPDRETYMDFTHIPLHLTAYTLFVNSDKNPQQYRGFEHLKETVIGVNRGFKTTPEFEEAREKGWIKRYDLNNALQGLKMLSQQRLDAILTNYHVGLFLIKANKIHGVVPLKPAVASTPAYFVFSRKKNLSYLVPAFDEMLMQVMIDGTYQKIFDRYTRLVETRDGSK